MISHVKKKTVTLLKNQKFYKNQNNKTHRIGTKKNKKTRKQDTTSESKN